MSTGKWTRIPNPNGHREDAELAARMEDVLAQLKGAQQELGILSQLVRQIERGTKKTAA